MGRSSILRLVAALNRSCSCFLSALILFIVVTHQRDEFIDQRDDIELIPDVLCNSGGVVVSYFEWLQNLSSFYWDRDEVMRKLFAILDKAKDSVEYQKRKFKFSRRLAALTLGIQRVADAKQSRGLFP